MKLRHVVMLCMLAVASLFVLTTGQAEAKPVSPDFVELSKRLKPTVVNIRTTKHIKPRAGSQFRGNDPFADLFGQFLASRHRSSPASSRGWEPALSSVPMVLS